MTDSDDEIDLLPIRALTEQEERFVDEYCVDLDTQRAAMTAGNTGKTYAYKLSRKWMADPAVKQAIKVRMRELAAASQVSAEWIRSRLKENVQRCQQAVPVLDKDGEPTGEYRFDANGANKALELLGKHLGMFQDKVVVTIEEELKNLPKEELERRLLAARELHAITDAEMNPVTGVYEAAPETQQSVKAVNPVEAYENA